MITKRVQLPDGSIKTVEAPDGATDEQILTFAKAYYYKQQAGQFQPTDPVAGMNNTQKFFAGMGKSLYDTARGFGNLVGLVSDEEQAANRDLDAPLMESGAALAGNIAGQVGQVLAPGGLLAAGGKGMARAAQGASTLDRARAMTQAGQTLANAGKTLMSPTNFTTGAALGAGYNFVQPGTMAERFASAGLGGIGGGIGGYVGGKLAIPPKAYPMPTATIKGGGYTFGTVGDDAARLSTAQRQAEKVGKKLGFKTTPGQSSGSRALQQMEAKLESQPMTSGPFNKIKDGNQVRLNQIAAESIGEKSDELSSPILEQARERISGMYKLVADDTPRKIDADTFLDVLDAIDDDGTLAGSIMDEKLVKRLFRLAEKGEATGKQLQNLTSKIGNKAATQMTSANGDRALGIALFNVKNHVDDLLADGLDESTAAAFKEARNQYRNLMLLTQRNGVINPSSGNVQGNALAGLLQQKDKPGFLFNKNQSDLYNAARFAQAFRPIVGDSGTATRGTLPGVTEAVVSAPLNVAGNAYLAFPGLVTYGSQATGRTAPLLGLLGGGAIGREMY